MFVKLILTVLIIILMSACAPDTSVIPSITPPMQEAAGLPAVTPLPCDINAVMRWEMLFPPSATLELEAAQLARDEYAARPFPECAAEAREFALAAHDARIRALQAEANGDSAASTAHMAEYESASRAYFNAIAALQPSQPLPPTAQPTVPVECPSMTAQCPELTCAQAQACFAAGNTSLDQDEDGTPCENVCQ